MKFQHAVIAEIKVEKEIAILIDESNSIVFVEKHWVKVGNSTVVKTDNSDEHLFFTPVTKCSCHLFAPFCLKSGETAGGEQAVSLPC